MITLQPPNELESKNGILVYRGDYRSLEWGSIHKTVQELFEAYSDALVGGSAGVSGEKILALRRANEKR